LSLRVVVGVGMMAQELAVEARVGYKLRQALQ
jgi:hypothetical protein